MPIRHVLVVAGAAVDNGVAGGEANGGSHCDDVLGRGKMGWMFERVGREHELRDVWWCWW